MFHSHGTVYIETRTQECGLVQMAHLGSPEDTLENIKSDSSMYIVGPDIGLEYTLIFLDGCSDRVDIFFGRYAGWQGWRPMFAGQMGWMTQVCTRPRAHYTPPYTCVGEAVWMSRIQAIAAHVHLSVAPIGHMSQSKLGKCRRNMLVSTALTSD